MIYRGSELSKILAQKILQIMRIWIFSSTPLSICSKDIGSI